MRDNRCSSDEPAGLTNRCQTHGLRLRLVSRGRNVCLASSSWAYARIPVNLTPLSLSPLFVSVRAPPNSPLAASNIAKHVHLHVAIKALSYRRYL